MSTKVDNPTDDIALNDEALEDVAGGTRRMMFPGDYPANKTTSLNGPNASGYVKANSRGITQLEYHFEQTTGGSKT